jgi:hypothetical protein
MDLEMGQVETKTLFHIFKLVRQNVQFFTKINLLFVSEQGVQIADQSISASNASHSCFAFRNNLLIGDK